MPAETPRVMLMLKRIRSLLSGLALALTGVGAVKRILALLCCFLLTSPSWAVNEKEIRALFWRNNAQNDAIYARYTMPASGTATSTLQAMSGANGYETTTLVNVELRGKVGDGVNQAADLISATASIPSLNFIPLTTFGNWF